MSNSAPVHVFDSLYVHVCGWLHAHVFTQVWVNAHYWSKEVRCCCSCLRTPCGHVKSCVFRACFGAICKWGWWRFQVVWFNCNRTQSALQSLCWDPVTHQRWVQAIYEFCMCFHISKCLVTSLLLKPLHHMTILVSRQQRQSRREWRKRDTERTRARERERERVPSGAPSFSGCERQTLSYSDEHHWPLSDPL